MKRWIVFIVGLACVLGGVRASGQYTAASYNMRGSGVASALIARDRIVRVLVIGDSNVSDTNAHRLNEAYYTRPRPASAIIGVFRGGYAAGANPVNPSFSAGTTGVAAASTKDPMRVNSVVSYTIGSNSIVTCNTAITPIVNGESVYISGTTGTPNPNGLRVIDSVSGSTFGFNPDLVTTGGGSSTGDCIFVRGYYTNLRPGLIPTSSQQLDWSAGTSGVFLTTSCTFFHPTGDSNTHTPSTTPKWWMDAVNVTTIWHEPKTALDGVTGPSFDIHVGRLAASGGNALQKSGATVTSTDAGTIRSRVDQILSTTDGRWVPQAALANPSSQSSKSMIPVGWYFQSATATEGISFVCVGWPGTRAGDWANTSLVPDATLTAFFTAIGSVDLVIVHVGHNLTPTQDTQLAAGTVTQFKTDIKADMTRMRSLLGANVKILLVMPAYFGKGTGLPNAYYDTMSTAMVQACDDLGQAAMVNPYHYGQAAATPFMAESWMKDTTGMSRISSSGSSDYHYNENGSALVVDCIYEQAIAADEASRSGIGGRRRRRAATHRNRNRRDSCRGRKREECGAVGRLHRERERVLGELVKVTEERVRVEMGLR